MAALLLQHLQECPAFMLSKLVSQMLGKHKLHTDSRMSQPNRIDDLLLDWMVNCRESATCICLRTCIGFLPADARTSATQGVFSHAVKPKRTLQQEGRHMRIRVSLLICGQYSFRSKKSQQTQSKERTESGNPHSSLVMICQADPLKNAAPQLGCIHLLTWHQLQWHDYRSRDYQHHNVLDDTLTSITKTLAGYFHC